MKEASSIHLEYDPGAEVVRREVYQKGEMIKKLVIIKTGRRGAIPYLIY